jgi:hypothetical protein
MKALTAARIARKARIVTPIGRSFDIYNHSFMRDIASEKYKNMAKSNKWVIIIDKNGK